MKKEYIPAELTLIEFEETDIITNESFPGEDEST